MTRRGAFTLIEVLVVVAIIALLISIMVPSLSAAKRLSKKTQCLHNLKQIGTGIESYLNVNRDYFPYLCRVPSIEAATAAASGTTPLLAMPKGFAREFGKDSKVFECPADLVTEPDPADPTVRVGGRYFDAEGTSYEWTTQVNGLHRNVKKVVYDSIPLPLRDVPLVFDFAPFHGSKYQPNNTSTLFADLHISK